jgi:endo-1,4-beta-D-glucanase Y
MKHIQYYTTDTEKYIRVIRVIFLASFLFPPIMLSCQKKSINSVTNLKASLIKEDGSGAFSTGQFRNLFLENGHTREEILTKNQAAFQQLFHGDSATQAIYFEAGKNENGPMAYVCDVLHNDVRSEGISYGMIIAVQMDKKAEFNAIWNWAVDWSWWAKDPREQELSNLIQTFFASQGIDIYGTQYTLDGQLLDKNHAKGLIATNAVVSLASTHPVAKDFTEALWNTPIPSAFDERYYDGLLYLMGMLHCSGEFRIWAPK